MSRRKPWMKWYPADWRAEPTLRMCRRPARSFWQDLIGLMHESLRYGHLLVNGIKPTPEQLARITGDSEREVRTWLDELEANGVYSKTPEGIIYSRRMVRDHEKAQQDEANGKDGGNPKLRRRDAQGVNPPHNPEPNPPENGGDKAQMLDARGQSSVPNGTDAAASPAFGIPLPLALVDPIDGDWSLTLFRPGLEWLANRTGKPPNALRSVLGKWLQACGQSHEAVFRLLIEAERQEIADPVGWITKGLEARGGNGKRKQIDPALAGLAEATFQ
jgi:hypothetical protein